jgi:hypothetical protein
VPEFAGLLLNLNDAVELRLQEYKNEKKLTVPFNLAAETNLHYEAEPFAYLRVCLLRNLRLVCHAAGVPTDAAIDAPPSLKATLRPPSLPEG